VLTAARLLRLEQAWQLGQGPKHRFDHAIVNRRRNGAEGGLRDRAVELPGDDALNAPDAVKPAAPGNVRGLARPGRDRPRTRRHVQPVTTAQRRLVAEQRRGRRLQQGGEACVDRLSRIRIDDVHVAAAQQGRGVGCARQALLLPPESERRQRCRRG
jgi:hypothetical protein